MPRTYGSGNSGARSNTSRSSGQIVSNRSSAPDVYEQRSTAVAAGSRRYQVSETAQTTVRPGYARYEYNLVVEYQDNSRTTTKYLSKPKK